MANIRPLSIELQQKATEEINEDVSRIPQDIQAIKDWLKQQKYIRARTDDQTIVTFLRGCKFSLERTKEKIESYYTMHTLLTDILRKRDPFQEEIQDLLKNGVILPIVNGKEDLTAPRYIISNLGGFDPDRVSKEAFVKLEFMIISILMNEDDRSAVCGMEFIAQLGSLKLAHVMSPALLKKSVKYVQDGMAGRTKGIHILNMPSFFERIVVLIKSFMNEKLKSRIYIFNKSNMEDLYNHIPKEVLPKEYGGNGRSLDELRDYWKEKVESYAEWFKEDDTYGTDESQRPGKPRTIQEFSGVEGVDGSFRKLNVD